MSKMWKGPSAALRAAHGDETFAAIHRRNGRNGVNCEMDWRGCRAEVFTISKGRDGEWYRRDLGVIEGETPHSTALKIAHAFTPFDADLVNLHYGYIESLAEGVLFDGRQIVKRIDAVTEDLQDGLNLVRA